MSIVIEHICGVCNHTWKCGWSEIAVARAVNRKEKISDACPKCLDNGTIVRGQAVNMTGFNPVVSFNEMKEKLRGMMEVPKIPPRSPSRQDRRYKLKNNNVNQLFKGSEEEKTNDGN